MNQSTFELSRSQQTVFKMEAFHLSGHRFYLGGVARLSGDISLDRLARAAEIVRDSQDVFHIGFVTDHLETGQLEIQWRGVRRDAPQVEVEKVDFSRHPEPGQAFESWAERQLLVEEALSLTPIRIFAVRFRQEQSGWFVKAHHAAADSAALAILMEHLAEALEQEAPAMGKMASPLFSVIAEGERDYDGSRRMERDAAYWRSVFGDTESASATKISCRYPIGDYRGLEPRSVRVRVTLSEVQNDMLRRFKSGGGSVFRLFFAAVAYTQMVIEDGNGALLQAPMLNRWSEDEKRSVVMAVAPVLVPVFREAGETVADCYRILKNRLQKAIVHSRYAPGARWGDFVSQDWKRIIPAFGVSYQTGVFQHTVSGAEVEINHIQAVEALFATVHIHDRFEGGCFKLEADFRKVWSSDQCRAFLQTVIDYAMEAAAEVMGQTEEVNARLDCCAEPIGVHLRDAFERYTDNVLFRQGTDVALGDLTYRQGLQWVSKFSVQLRGQHFGRSPVLILGRRSPETILAYLTCLIENVTVVPVCPTTPLVRLSTIVRNSGASLCIYTVADQDLAEALDLPRLRVSLDKTLCDAMSHPEERPGATWSKQADSNPAYILYTSGSTGEPKGVAISSIALANYALAAKEAYAAGVPFNTPLFTSFGFDLTQTAILVPVLSGGFIQAYEQDIRDNPALLRTLLADESLTGVKCTPSHFSLLIEHSPKRRNPLTFVVGGENLPAALVNKAFDFYPPGSKVINEYGPTEATVGCCIYSVSGFDGNSKTNAAITTPIGKALGKAEISIRDAWGQNMPRGFRGEIWIGGPVLADGYLNNSTQTEAKFVHSVDGRRRWYRTGDLGLQDEQGIFHCFGRIDDEFKVRGHRIHPAEIEKAVKDALAYLGRDDDHHWQLKALKLIVDDVDGIDRYETVVLCSSKPVPYDSHDFQRSLKDKIPDTWLPGLYCTVQPWPVNANGKVDMAALTAEARRVAADSSHICLVDEKGLRAPKAYKLPSWLDVEFLRPIWPQTVDLTAPFLAQGGDSIKAIRLVALLAREGVRIGASELLTSTALGSVLEKACAEKPEDTVTDAAVLEAFEANWVKYLPSVRWFREHRFKHGNRLQQGVVLELPRSISAGRINVGVATVKVRHKIFSLRANRDLNEFYFSSSEPERHGGHVLEQREALAQGEHLEDRLNKLQGEVCLENQPSVHEVVFDPVSNKNYLIWVCHHLICDVHSWIFLLDELDQALNESVAQANADVEQGAFLWGKWLWDHASYAEPALHDDAFYQPAIAPVTLALSISGDSLGFMAQCCKAERSQLIAAALMEVMQDNGMLPERPAVLFENHGRLFSEAEMPAVWNVAMANAVGWFTGFNQLNLHVSLGRPRNFLRVLKSRLYESSLNWQDQLGLNGTGVRPLICVNDIGLGLGSRGTWGHFNLVYSLSGGFRHPDEKSVADFDMLIRDCRESGSVFVELRLGIPGADGNDARRYLTQLNERLSAWNDVWNKAFHDGQYDGQADHRPERALIPSDFPLCQLSQSELDLIINGASA